MDNGKRFDLPSAGWMVLASFLMLLGSIQAAEAMVVWTDHATVKIRREISLTAPKTNQTSAVLKAAKNEFEAFQIIVSADSGNLSGVDVTVSDLAGPNGSLIPGSAVMIYKAAFINITTLSTTEGRLGFWPDALIPKRDEYTREVRNAFPFSVTSGRNQPVWIEIYVPQDAAPGLYRGTATVTAANQAPVVVPIELTIWNFVLPSTSTLESAYSIDYHLIPIGHGLGSAYLNYLDLIKTYAKANLLHRITNDYLPGPHIVSGGWDAFTTRFGPLMDGTERFPGGKLPGAKMTSYRMSIWAQETNVAFLRDIAQRAAARGWIDRLFAYTFDEPKPNQPAQWQTIKDRARALHQADPRLRSLVTTSIQGAGDFGITQCGSPRVEPCLDLFTPTIRYLDNKPTGREPGSEVPGGVETIGNQRSKYGPETWWYQACGSHGCGIIGGGQYDPEGYHTGWPTFMIDLPAMFNRVMQWQTFKYNLQGELYFDMVYAYGQRDPWVSQYDFGGNGDGTLYYPGTPAKIGGTTHIPIESIRLKLLREGMEDYEYMNLLAKLGDGDYAERQVDTVATRIYDWSRNPADLYRARENMALQILSHDASGGPTPGTADFKLSYSPASVTMIEGGAASSQVILSSLFDFNAAVALTCAAPHPSVSCTVSPASVTPPVNGSGTAILRIATQSATPLGAHPVTLRAVSGGLIREGTVALTVTAATPVGEPFDRADGTDLGPSWNEYMTDFGISGNQVVNLDAASQEAYWTAPLGPDQDVAADCKAAAAGSSCGVMARWSSADNFYYVRLDAGLGDIALFKKVNGTYTKLGTALRPMGYDTYYRLRLVVEGSTLSVYFAGENTPAIMLNDPSLNTGDYAGIRSYAAAVGATWFDRFHAVSSGNSDTFNRADDTNLGSNWNEYLADFGINGNEVANLDAASQEARWTASLGPNQEVSADCKTAAAGSSCGVMARWVDDGNYYYLRLDPGLGNIVLFKKVNGVYTALGSADRTMAFNTFYRLRLVANGNTLTAYFAGETTPTITATDTSLVGAFSGIRSYAAAVGATGFDRFNAVSLGGRLGDPFNRANGTDLGSGWNEYLLNFEVNGNQLRNSDTAGQEAQWTPVIGADQDVSADCMATAAGNSCGVTARWSDPNNFYYALVDPGLGSVALIKRVNGVFTRLAIASRPMSYNTFYPIRLVARGSSLRVFFNGESAAAIDLSDTVLVSGNYAGVRSYASAAAATSFDNFSVGHP
ncbi:MAG: DUF4091 domain-containing protein [Candidatus Manganitrophus sp. SA1]|nr:DUF4091 domain-containing protein [Candidatus Manganitrophus morganii]